MNKESNYGSFTAGLPDTNRSAFLFPSPEKPMEFTGERFVSGLNEGKLGTSTITVTFSRHAIASIKTSSTSPLAKVTGAQVLERSPQA